MEKSNNSSEKYVLDFTLNRLWDSYALADDRRRKAFYYLFSVMAVFVILWITKDKSFELPFLKTKVDMFLAMMLAPAFIAMLTARYLYLCAHTLRAYIQFLECYEDSCREGLQKLGYSFGKLYPSFERRDITEKLNIFLFPMHLSGEWDKSINNIVGRIVCFLCNIGIILTVAIPIISYIVCFFGWYAIRS